MPNFPKMLKNRVGSLMKSDNNYINGKNCYDQIQWIYFHGKITLQSNFWHFVEQHFTSALSHEFPFTPHSCDFLQFHLKSHWNGQIDHSNSG